MIVGTGVDLERVDRIRAAIERHGKRFLDRVFTPGEIAYVEARIRRWESYAARFAAKEAAMKALGTGWDHGVRWVDVEIVREEGGRPELRFHGKAAEIAAKLGCRSTNVSLSHTSDNAIAQVILEG
jgi:holo-[acyl-carrier protein] synthase